MGPSEQPQPALGKAVRQLREQRGVSQEALAYEAGVTSGTLSLIERGLSNPTWGTVRGIAAALGISIADLARMSLKFDE
jgi:XRE family transcriptional regulator, regulator of sulfur utilization